MFFSCTNEIKDVMEIINQNNLPVQTTYDAIYWFSDSAIVRNRLAAGILERFTGDTNYTYLSEGVELLFFNPDGTTDAILTSRNAVIWREQGIMEARDSVRFVNVEGERLFTERLVWNRDSNKVYTRSHVTIERANDIIYGKGLESNHNFTRYRIIEVSGVFYIEDEN
jgi:LPS export ABC transporter protein LptC